MDTVIIEKTARPQLQTRRLVIFLAFAFGIAWLTGLIIYLTGGLVDSPVLVQSPPITLALVLLATAYMWAPALGNIFTRLLTHEGFHDLALRPKLKRGWPFWLAAWFTPGILTILGMLVYFAIFPAQFDPKFSVLQQGLDNAARLSGRAIPITAQAYFFIQIAEAVILAPILNALAVFGEEFGWRAYLQPKLMTLGTRRALLVVGLIWGVWHWPVIFMGYEYGFNYWGAPFTGPLLFLVFTVSLAILFGWLVLLAGSVWPSVIAHGAINGIAALGLVAVIGKPNMLLGPTPIGLLGGLPLILLAGFIILRLPRIATANSAPSQQL
ncbi:MAG: CPBP family intramembrane metalloprotease [Anaerolineaceae bacterium]|nr:CPBP family intramembrane metalloprotease [Anaerolineaceae bacterium]